VPVATPAARGETVPVAEWDAMTEDGQPVRVVLWRDLEEPPAGEPEPEPEPPPATDPPA